MKTYLQIILLAIFIIGINGEVEVCSQSISSPSEDVCRMYPTDIDYTHCCYIERDGDSYCDQLTDDQYENVKKYKKYLKEHLGYSSVKIKCSGEFLTYSLFVLLALLF